ncbi:hypothetical protein [Streptomyces sp. NPDC056160]|uniref:hypothetical protein n=1 Tax=Streptomyces sp. NPDC056160 TaxID=3345731 RepID=UPI0035D536DF
MTQSQSELSPYDTEPKLWQPDSEAVAEVMHSGEVEDIGNVDFTNHENGTVVTVHVSRGDDGLYTVHLMPMCDEHRIRVALHRETDLAIIEPVPAGRYEPRHTGRHACPNTAAAALETSCEDRRVTRRADSNDC